MDPCAGHKPLGLKHLWYEPKCVSFGEVNGKPAATLVAISCAAKAGMTLPPQETLANTSSGSSSMEVRLPAMATHGAFSGTIRPTGLSTGLSTLKVGAATS